MFCVFLLADVSVCILGLEGFLRNKSLNGNKNTISKIILARQSSGFLFISQEVAKYF